MTRSEVPVEPPIADAMIDEMAPRRQEKAIPTPPCLCQHARSIPSTASWDSKGPTS